jgi:pimeloyl-ACP methyl ester carboxylesterase
MNRLTLLPLCFVASLGCFLPGCALYRYQSATPLHFADVVYAQPVEYITVQGIKTAYVRQGHGPETFLLIHGLAATVQLWEKTIPALARHGEVIALDLPGFGKSAKPHLDYGLDFYATFLHELLGQLGKERATLVAHSMGGQIALTYALKYQGSVTSLILISPAGFETYTPGEAQLLNKYVNVASIRAIPEDQIRVNWRLSVYEWRDEYERFIEERTRLAKTPEIADWAWACVRGMQAMLEEPVAAKLHQIHRPAHLIFGEYDGVIPNPILHGGNTVGVARAAQQALSGSSLVLIPAAGHLPMLEQPELTNQAIAEFLTRR